MIIDPCENCPTKLKALGGKGSLNSPIFIIGWNPGIEEYKKEEIFVGRSGYLLTKTLEDLSLIEKSYLFNAVSCYTQTGKVTDKHINSCRGRLLAEIERVKPKVIILLGAVAIKALLPDLIQSIAKLRKTIQKYQEIPVIITYHPSFLLRGGGLSSPSYLNFKEDIAKVERFLTGVNIEVTKEPPNYRMISRKEDVILLLEEASKQKIVAVDFETNTKISKNIFKKGAKPLCLSFSYKENSGYCIPLDHPESSFLNDLPWLYSVISSYLEETPLLSHNCIFEGIVFQKWFSKKIKVKEDSLLLSYLFNEHISHSLNDLLNSYTDIFNHKVSYFKYDTVENDKIPLPDLALANLQDADGCLRIYNKFKQELSEEELAFYSDYMMAKFIPFTKHMTVEGMSIDTDFVRKLLPKYLELKNIFKEVGRDLFDISISSDQQVAKKFLELGFVLPHTDKGNHSVSKDSLNSIRSFVPEKKKIILDYLDHYNAIEYLLTYYLYKVFDLIGDDQKIHSSFKVHGTKSGRLSSSALSLQNIPKGNIIQKMFKANGYFVSFDYSTHELRYFAMLMRDEKMLRAFRQGFDIHSYTASSLFNTIIEEVTKEERNIAKSSNFLGLYGGGAKTQAKKLSISLEKAQEFLAKYRKEFPAIQRYYEGNEQEYREKNYISTPWGRRYKNPPLTPLRFTQRQNLQIQGGANYVVLVAGYNLMKAGFRVVQQVHDSLTVELDHFPRKEEILEIYRICREVEVPGFEDIKDLWDGSIEIGRNLYEMEKLN